MIIAKQKCFFLNRDNIQNIYEKAQQKNQSIRRDTMLTYAG